MVSAKRYLPASPDVQVLWQLFDSADLLVPIRYSEAIAAVRQSLRRLLSLYENGNEPPQGEGILLDEDTVTVLERLLTGEVLIPISWAAAVGRLAEAVRSPSGELSTEGEAHSLAAEAHRAPATETSASPATDDA